MIQVRKEKTNTSTSKRRRQWHPTQVLLPGKFHGQRSLVGCSPWGCQELDRTKRVHFHLSLSCIGEGNGNPRQCSCLENPRDGGAWWAAIYGVAQSQTGLKRGSSSSSSASKILNLKIQSPGSLFSIIEKKISRDLKLKRKRSQVICFD